jgi:hypothetical protein
MHDSVFVSFPEEEEVFYRFYDHWTDRQIFDYLFTEASALNDSFFELSFACLTTGITFYWAFLNKWLQNTPEIVADKDDARYFVPLVTMLVPWFIQSFEMLIDNIHTNYKRTSMWTLSLLIPITYIDFNIYM